MIKYRTGGWGKNLIEEIEIIRETAKQVVYMARWGNEEKERKEAKRSSYQNYFDSWQEAKQFLLDQSQNRIDRLRLQLQQANGEHGNIKGLKEPE